MLRNREFRRFAIVYLVLTAALTTGGFFLSRGAGFAALSSSVILGTAGFLYTRARYRVLARLSGQIERVLHNLEHWDVESFDEGELSILYSEITKMTLRIRAQNDAIKKDKQHLADSLADIAHQLRTPLTSANLVLSFLANASDEQERQSLVREVEDLVRRMDWLITSLLKLSRLDAGVVEFQTKPISVNKLVNSAVRPLAISMELRGVTVTTDIPPNVVILGDANWLGEAVQNILKNCMEHIGSDGSIHIRCVDNVLYSELVIHDDGSGFRKEDLPHLFDRFYRGSGANATGYGIGLALCKSVVTRQNGSVTAKNHPEGGAVFRIRFPKVTNPSPQSHRDVI